MNGPPIDLHGERIKRGPTRPFVMISPHVSSPFEVMDLYRERQDLQRIGLIHGAASHGVGITSRQARALAAQLLVAADALDERMADQEGP